MSTPGNCGEERGGLVADNRADDEVWQEALRTSRPLGASRKPCALIIGGGSLSAVAVLATVIGVEGDLLEGALLGTVVLMIVVGFTLIFVGAGHVSRRDQRWRRRLVEHGRSGVGTIRQIVETGDPGFGEPVIEITLDVRPDDGTPPFVAKVQYKTSPSNVPVVDGLVPVRFHLRESPQALIAGRFAAPGDPGAQVDASVATNRDVFAEDRAAREALPPGPLLIRSRWRPGWYDVHVMDPDGSAGELVATVHRGNQTDFKKWTVTVYSVGEQRPLLQLKPRAAYDIFRTKYRLSGPFDATGPDGRLIGSVQSEERLLRRKIWRLEQRGVGEMFGRQRSAWVASLRSVLRNTVDFTGLGLPASFVFRIEGREVLSVRKWKGTRLEINHPEIDSRLAIVAALLL